MRGKYARLREGRIRFAEVEGVPVQEAFMDDISLAKYGTPIQDEVNSHLPDEAPVPVPPSNGEHSCYKCGRVGTRNFEKIELPIGSMFRCTGRKACDARMQSQL